MTDRDWYYTGHKESIIQALLRREEQGIGFYSQTETSYFKGLLAPYIPDAPY